MFDNSIDQNKVPRMLTINSMSSVTVQLFPGPSAEDSRDHFLVFPICVYNTVLITALF